MSFRTENFQVIFDATYLKLNQDTLLILHEGTLRTCIYVSNPNLHLIVCDHSYSQKSFTVFGEKLHRLDYVTPTKEDVYRHAFFPFPHECAESFGFPDSLSPETLARVIQEFDLDPRHECQDIVTPLGDGYIYFNSSTKPMPVTDNSHDSTVQRRNAFVELYLPECQEPSEQFKIIIPRMKHIKQFLLICDERRSDVYMVESRNDDEISFNLHQQFDEVPIPEIKTSGNIRPVNIK